MKRAQLACVTLAALALSAVLHADSPLTSTDLASAYAEIPAVKEALAGRRMTPGILRVLIADGPTDRKAAVVNALGWQSPGNALAFLNGLAAARGVAPDDITLAQLTAADRFVLGYMLALETYASPDALRPGTRDVWGATPMQLLDQAATALPRDFTVHLVRALVEAQHAMETSRCSVYMATARVFEKFPERRRNLRLRAIGSVQAYMDLYKRHCTAAPAAAPRPGRPAALNPEHDQIYALARLGDTIVAGTQAGLVIWHPDQRAPVSSRDEDLCASLRVWRNAVWAGCSARVVRWDGSSWKAYFQDPGRQETFAIVAGAGDELIARYGRDVWRYDAARDTFVAARMDLGKIPHDVIVRRNGEIWHIDFSEKVIGPNRAYAVKSDEYAGSDPRNLVEDAAGRLWVMDFDSGAFRLDESTGSFEREAAVGNNVIDVAVDTARARTWFLHYTDGPILHEKDNRRETVNLRRLEYMRDLLLDEQTGDVWVAGWQGLVRLREQGGRWAPTTWRVPR